MGPLQRRLILYVGLGIIAAWYAVLMGAFVFGPALTNAIRVRSAELLSAELGAQIRFQSFDVRFFPWVRVTARGVTVGSDPSRPLIRATLADARAGLLPWHVRRLVLEGLSVSIPTAQGPEVTLAKPGLTITVDEIWSEHAHVEILPSTGESKPMRFEVGELHISNFNPSHAAGFSATLVTTQPRAGIQAAGSLGPWNPQDPSLTPLQGTYTMPRCELATLPGLEGILTSQGQFQGVVQRVEIAGEASAAQFGLSLSGHPEPMHASFQAALDASDGSASIEHVNGMLQSTPFSASGVVRNVQDDRLRDIALNISVSRGRLEDLLPLAVQSKTSPISGALRLEAKLEILAGEQNILDRLRLDADFAAPESRFSSLDLRERLRQASRKAEGHPKSEASGSSLASIQGHVQLTPVAPNIGVAEFPDLVFDLEGASARLKGTYQLASERLDLHGEVWIAAKLSQTATGAKALLLKAAQPFFHDKHGGSHIPIKITGTRSDPQFSLDIGGKAVGAGSHARGMLFSH
jgi:hypothetical protein